MALRILLTYPLELPQAPPQRDVVTNCLVVVCKNMVHKIIKEKFVTSFSNFKRDNFKNKS